MTSDAEADQDARNDGETISADAARWNARYQDVSAPVGEPARVLIAAAPWLPAGGRALDLACGLGANALWLAARGFDTFAWDIASRAIDTLGRSSGTGRLQCEVRDVVARPPDAASFELVVVSRFLDRSLCPALSAALVPGGVLCYQTFTQGLSNPDYLLAANELLTLFPDLDIRWYHETSNEALLVAQRAPA